MRVYVKCYRLNGIFKGYLRDFVVVDLGGSDYYFTKEEVIIETVDDNSMESMSL